VCVVRYQHIQHIQNLRTTALTVDQFGVDFCFKACALCVRLLQKHRLQYVYATVLWHCQSADDQSCPIHSYAFFYKKNAIITLLHKEYLTDSVKIKLPSDDISVTIFTYRYSLSFIKFVQKNCDKYVEKQMYHFLWTRCMYDICTKMTDIIIDIMTCGTRLLLVHRRPCFSCLLVIFTPHANLTTCTMGDAPLAL